MSRIHVIGAGLAGLSAAVTATAAGRAVTVYESTAAGGGRCRSFFDTELGIRLDNGNHMLMSGNKSAFAYINQIGARLHEKIRDPEGQSIFVRADENVPFGAFATVMDAVKQAGITNVSIVTQPLEKNGSRH